MEDDGQHETIEVRNDEEDDNEEGVSINTPIGPVAVLMDTATPQLAQDDDDDALCFHCIECNRLNCKKHLEQVGWVDGGIEVR